MATPRSTHPSSFTSPARGIQQIHLKRIGPRISWSTQLLVRSPHKQRCVMCQAYNRPGGLDSLNRRCLILKEYTMWTAHRIPKWIAVGVAVALFAWWATRHTWASTQTICNRSTTSVWLTTWSSGGWGNHKLIPGSCSSEYPWKPVALWGYDCSTGDCRSQVWRVGPGLTWLEGDNRSIVTIHPQWPLSSGGWWGASEPWPGPAPEATIEYTLAD